MRSPRHGLAHVAVPIQMGPQATLQAFRLNEPKGALPFLEGGAITVLVKEFLVHRENLLVVTPFVSQQAFQGRSCGSTVGSPFQVSDGILHADLLPSKGHHGAVHLVTVGHPLHKAHVSIQWPQRFQNARFEIAKGSWHMLRLRHIFTFFASRALAWSDGRIVDPLQIHWGQGPGLHAAALGAGSPGALLAPGFNHLAFVIGWTG